ncbi:hypothetical protein ACJIZ3_023762 [Penstemon smallii]|uniref:Uncharacterized protein n=1 Tax=Penstemon smallii TaxID=265156 RepID=A0ABD3TRC7_9LAMI
MIQVYNLLEPNPCISRPFHLFFFRFFTNIPTIYY